jgi:Asp-tRNA(Asn)/Glu-tRNA(Gln) amidotransferase C subunit
VTEIAATVRTQEEISKKLEARMEEIEAIMEQLNDTSTQPNTPDTA